MSQSLQNQLFCYNLIVFCIFLITHSNFKYLDFSYQRCLWCFLGLFVMFFISVSTVSTVFVLFWLFQWCFWYNFNCIIFRCFWCFLALFMMFFVSVCYVFNVCDVSIIFLCIVDTWLMSVCYIVNLFIIFANIVLSISAYEQQKHHIHWKHYKHKQKTT